MIFFILIFAFFFIVSTFIIVDIVLIQPKHTYKIVWGYTYPSDFDLIEATSAAKAMKKFRKRHCLATVYSIEEEW